MTLSINSNIASFSAQRNLLRSTKALGDIFKRMSSGLRINQAKDDAAGLSISTRFETKIRELNQLIRNSNDSFAALDVASSAIGSIAENINRIRELSVQSSNDTYTDTDRSYFQSEVNQLLSDINRIVTQTEYNSIKVLSEFEGTDAIESTPIYSLISSGSVTIPAKAAVNKVPYIFRYTADTSGVNVSYDNSGSIDGSGYFSVSNQDRYDYEQKNYDLDGDGFNDRTNKVEVSGTVHNKTTQDADIGGYLVRNSVDLGGEIATIGTLVERDLNTVGDQLITYDQTSQLEWLNLSETRGESYNEILTGSYVTGASSFRYATETEFNEFITNSGITTTDETEVASLQSLVGFTTNDSQDLSIGYLAEENGETNVKTGQILKNYLVTYDLYTQKDAYASANADDFAKANTDSGGGAGVGPYDLVQKGVTGQSAKAASTYTIYNYAITDWTDAIPAIPGLIFETKNNGSSVGVNISDFSNILNPTGTTEISEILGFESNATSWLYSDAINLTGGQLYDPYRASDDLGVAAGAALGSEYVFVPRDGITKPQDSSENSGVTTSLFSSNSYINKFGANGDNPYSSLVTEWVSYDADGDGNQEPTQRILPDKSSAILDPYMSEVAGFQDYLSNGTSSTGSGDYWKSDPQISSEAISANYSLKGQEQSERMIKIIDIALEKISTEQGTIGAAQNRLTSMISNHLQTIASMTDSRSRIMDADIASEASKLAQQSIIQKAAIAILAQANQQPQIVLQLLG